MMKKMMTKARLIKKQEIKEREAQRDSESTEGRERETPRLSVVAEWQGRAKRHDPRKAFADLFAQPQTQ